MSSVSHSTQDSPEEQIKAPAPFHPDLVWREEVTGSRPGDRVVRIARHRSFQSGGPGVLLARPEAAEPRGGLGRLSWRLKRVVVGEPIPSEREMHERLTKVKALAVLSSDALSSVAYGTEAVMRILIYAGIAALGLTMLTSLSITLLLVIVATSYQQTVAAHPSGGGSYIVARENLGTLPGLTAGASLLIDYVLTVSVSVAAGVAAITSAFPELQTYSVEVSLVAVLLLTVLNLRGIRESGTIFAAPTYVFIISVFGLIGMGLFRLMTGGIPYEQGGAGP